MSRSACNVPPRVNLLYRSAGVGIVAPEVRLVCWSHS